MGKGKRIFGVRRRLCFVKRAMIIGLDCVPPRLVFDRWASELPVLFHLRKNSAWGGLRSTSPPITVPAWACMASGRDPGELGIYGFRNMSRERSYDLRVASSRDVKVKRLWDLVSEAGGRAASLFVPLTYPASPLRGTMFSGFLTPPGAADWAFPPQKAREFEARFGTYRADVANFRMGDDALPRIFDELDAMRVQHFDVAKAVWKEDAPNLMMMVELGPDRLHHAAWHHMEEESEFAARALEYYKALDASVGELVELADDDTLVVIASDHGAKTMQGGVAMNELLRELGYVSLKSDETQVAPLRERVQWSETQAWCEGGYYSRLFLNVRGREEEGVVDAKDFDATRSEVIDALTKVLSEHGVTLRAEIPAAHYVATRGQPPDALLYLDELDYRALGTVGHASPIVPTSETGPDGCNHDWNGMVLLSGPGVVARELNGADILDVAPTVLAHLGLSRDGLRGKDLRS